jgi:malonyl CoA-acyl carrier protein transacylase
MCTPWLEAFPNTAKPILEEIDETLKLPLTKTIESGTNAELTRTENAQPAIMATSILILRILEKDFGFKTSERVDITLGHSLGEFAALVAGGYLTFRDALKMVRRRAEVMSKCSQEAVAEEGGEHSSTVSMNSLPWAPKQTPTTIYQPSNKSQSQISIRRTKSSSAAASPASTPCSRIYVNSAATIHVTYA